MSNRTTDVSGNDSDDVKRIDVGPNHPIAEYVSANPLMPILGQVEGERRFVILSYPAFVRLWQQRHRPCPPASEN